VGNGGLKMNNIYIHGDIPYCVYNGTGMYNKNIRIVA
jgi:hypothetical protein